MAEWDAWIGRTEERQDRVDRGALSRWLATLDRDAPDDGTAPQGYHWCLCAPDAPTATLGEDGHPRREDGPAGFLPPVPLPRRMWASSRVAFLQPLRSGEALTRHSRIASLNEKQGGSGRLFFVDVEHELHGASGLAVREVQSIVYRDAATPDAPLAPPPPGTCSFDASAWDMHRRLVPTEPLLFRYSALTFNSHRIHYDAPYATREERYRGLVVHGPLTATLLLDLARHRFGDNVLTHFTFRGLSPAICGEVLHLGLRGPESALELGAFADDGRPVMSATASAKTS